MQEQVHHCGTRAYPMGRVFCIGRNYAEHIAELSNEVPDEPLIFMKPRECLWAPGRPVPLPPGEAEVAMETELVVLMGEASSEIAGLALGLDLTRRETQKVLKEKGHPWERAKAFEASAPLGPWTPYHREIHRLDGLRFEGWVNGICRQSGDTGEMLFSIAELIDHVTRLWQLRAGDLIFTGTPAGVGPLYSGDEIELRSDHIGGARWVIA